MLQKLALVMLAALICAAPQRAQGLEGARVSIVLTHVTVIDTAGGTSQPDMTVVIDGGRITRVGKKRLARIPKTAKEIDATGKYLIPGLWDMHVHTSSAIGYPADGKSRCRCLSPTELPACATWAASSI